MTLDIRWQQRFANFCQALDQLETSFLPPALNERERQGLIKVFEYCFELGWNSLRLAFRVGLIRDGEAGLAMVQEPQPHKPPLFPGAAWCSLANTGAAGK